MVGQQTLNLFILVRIQVSEQKQPLKAVFKIRGRGCVGRSSP